MLQRNLTRWFQRTRAAKKILALNLGFLGDAVHLIPALWEIKRNYPGAALHVLTSPVGAEVLRLVPCVDRIWTVELYPDKRSWREHRQVAAALRREHLDLAFNFNGTDRSIFLTALCRARRTVAHAAGRRHFWNRLLIWTWVPRCDPLLPVYEQQRQVLGACGLILQPPRWDLRIPSEAAQRAESLVPAGALHFSISASTPLKEWPLEHWIALAKQLLAAEPGLRLVATSSAAPREQDRVRALVNGVQNDRLTALPPGLSIADLAAVLQHCQAHIGADSGVLHLAVAAGLPTVSLFRGYHDASAWMPAGTAHRVLSQPCACVNQRRQPCTAAARADCLAQIQPPAVEQAIRSLRTG